MVLDCLKMNALKTLINVCMCDTCFVSEILFDLSEGEYTVKKQQK